MRKKVDSRIRTLVENCVKTRQRSLFVIIGDKVRTAGNEVWGSAGAETGATGTIQAQSRGVRDLRPASASCTHCSACTYSQISWNNYANPSAST